MTPETITYALTAMTAVVVVLTRVRLGSADREPAGRRPLPAGVLNLHTGAGLVGVATWTGFLFAEKDVIGYVGLGFLWLTAVAGLIILARWLPPRGRHSTGPVGDSWGEGPGLSILAHLGVLAAVGILTAFMVLDKLS